VIPTRGFDLGALPRRIANLACDISPDTCFPFVEEQCAWRPINFTRSRRRKTKECCTLQSAERRSGCDQRGTNVHRGSVSGRQPWPNP
jgi:hypothetical protein